MLEVFTAFSSVIDPCCVSCRPPPFLASLLNCSSLCVPLQRKYQMCPEISSCTSSLYSTQIQLARCNSPVLTPFCFRIFAKASSQLLSLRSISCHNRVAGPLLPWLLQTLRLHPAIFVQLSAKETVIFHTSLNVHRTLGCFLFFR